MVDSYTPFKPSVLIMKTSSIKQVVLMKEPPSIKLIVLIAEPSSCTEGQEVQEDNFVSIMFD